MNRVLAIVAAGMIVSAASSALAQSAGAQRILTTTKPPNGIVGVLAPNGTFRPMIVVQPASATPTPRVFAGTITAALNIVIASPLPAGATVHCGLSATVEGLSDAGQTDVVLDSDQVAATGVTATAATCQFTLPYQWGLFGNTPNATIRDTVSLSYSITAINATGDGRQNSVSFGTIAVPAAGAFTNFTLNARI